jgi:3-methyladenine DNA glycosylase AlkD
MKIDMQNWRERAWTANDYRELVEFLRAQSDREYQVFNEKIINGERATMGVRLSVLRPLSREIAKGARVRDYLKLVKGETHEEVLLEGMVMGLAKLEYKELLAGIDNYISKIDSWGLCDSFVSSWLLRGYEAKFWRELPRYLGSKNLWAKRFAVIVMMEYYLDEEHINEVLEMVAAERSEEYYVQMAQAWLLATAWVKQRERVKGFMEANRGRLGERLWRMTGQKMRDSRRVAVEDKKWTLSKA